MITFGVLQHESFKNHIMKTIILSAIAALFTLTAMAQTEGVSIKVVIDNVPSDEGKVLISLHKKETFMRGAGIESLASTIENGKVEFTFTNVPPGTYAIVAMHDKNGNEQMDMDDNGEPLESWGLSGNDMSFGPPEFDLAKFEVSDKDLDFNIRF